MLYHNPPIHNLYPVWQHTFVSPSAFSRRAVVSYWRKNVHEVLVNRLEGLSLPRKSVVSLTDRQQYTIFSMRYSLMCKVLTGYHGTGETEHVLCACTVDNTSLKLGDISPYRRTNNALSLTCSVYFGFKENKKKKRKKENTNEWQFSNGKINMLNLQLVFM